MIDYIVNSTQMKLLLYLFDGSFNNALIYFIQAHSVRFLIANVYREPALVHGHCSHQDNGSALLDTNIHRSKMGEMVGSCTKISCSDIFKYNSIHLSNEMYQIFGLEIINACKRWTSLLFWGEGVYDGKYLGDQTS